MEVFVYQIFEVILLKLKYILLIKGFGMKQILKNKTLIHALFLILLFSISLMNFESYIFQVILLVYLNYIILQKKQMKKSSIIYFNLTFIGYVFITNYY